MVGWLWVTWTGTEQRGKTGREESLKVHWEEEVGAGNDQDSVSHWNAKKPWGHHWISTKCEVGNSSRFFFKSQRIRNLAPKQEECCDSLVTTVIGRASLIQEFPGPQLSLVLA